MSLTTQIAIFLAATVIAVPLFRRFKLSAVLGYLAAGMVVGPWGLGLFQDVEAILHLSEFGVVMLLFVIGLELQPSRLWVLRHAVFLGGAAQVAVTTILLALAIHLLGQPWPAAVVIGFALSLSSTALILQVLAERGELNTRHGRSAFAILLFQDLAIMPALVLLPFLAGGSGEAMSWRQVALPALAIVATVGAGRYLLRPVLRIVANTRAQEAFTAAALLVVVGTALLFQASGLSMALGAFIAGVLLADSEYRHELEADIEPFKGLLLGLFFIAVGASVDFGLIAARPGMVAALVVLLVVVKIAVLASLGFVFRMRLDQNLLFAFALSQVGEFAFVLLSFASQQGVLAPPVTSPLVAVVALSMALTPLLLLVNDRFVRPRFETAPSDAREADAIHEENEVIIAGFGRFGTIVGRLLRANGVGTTVLDVDADKIDLLRRMGLKVFYGDASRTDLLKAAGAPKARLLVLAVDDPGKTLELVHLARRHFPHLTILARAADRSDAYELIDAGVTHIYRETLDTSLRVGVDALRLLGFRGYQAQRAARQFFRHDEESVRLMTSLRGDRARYVSLARERIADLERTLLADLEDSDGLDRDAGWDAESLRDEVRALSGAVKEL